MKKLALPVLFILIMLTLIGCSKSATETSRDSSPKTEQTESGVIVEKEIFDIKLNLPNSLFTGKNLETVKKDALAQGVHEVIINNDGSLTYIMSKGKYREMMDGIGKSINDSITEFLSKEENKNIFKEIVFNKDYSELNVKVDSGHYAPLDEIRIAGFKISSMVYQAFNGVDKSKMVIKTNIMDSSGAMIKTNIMDSSGTIK